MTKLHPSVAILMVITLLLGITFVGYAESNTIIIQDKAFSKGDIDQNHDINLKDLEKLDNILSNLKTKEPTYNEKRLGDMNNDNRLTSEDYKLLKDVIMENTNKSSQKSNEIPGQGYTAKIGNSGGSSSNEGNAILGGLGATIALVATGAVVKNMSQPATTTAPSGMQQTQTPPKTVTMNTANGPVTGTVNSAGQIIGPNGNIIGTYSNGNIYSPTGVLIGAVNPTTGQIVNGQGNVVGSTTGSIPATQTVTWTTNGTTYTGTVGSGGVIYDAQGNPIGVLGANNVITMPNGTQVGTLTSSGSIINSAGQQVGSSTTTTATTPTTGGTATAGALTITGVTNGQTLTSYATATLTAATTGNTTATYSWVSSNPAVVSLSPIATSGTKSVTMAPLKNGIVTITVTDSAGNTISINLTVQVQEQIAWTTASLVPNIYINQPITYTAVVKDVNGNVINGRTISYSLNAQGSSLVNMTTNPANNTVTLTATGVGPVILTAQDQVNPNLTVSQAITCQGIKIDMGTVSLNPIISLNPITINPRVTYTDGTTITNPTISFALQDTTGRIATLSNPTIGANPSVVLQPVGNGTTQLIITVNNVPYYFPVNVSLNATLQITGPLYVKIPYTASYSSFLQDTAGNAILNQIISWTTDNVNLSSIMAVANNTYQAILTPLGAGSAIITATNGSVKGLLPISLITPSVMATNLPSIVTNTASISSQITLTYMDGTTANPTTLNFAYTNNNPNVATINDLGNGNILIVPLTNGSMSFTVKITPKGNANILTSGGFSQTLTSIIQIAETVQIAEVDPNTFAPMFSYGTPIFIKAPAKATVGAMVTDQLGNDITSIRVPINFSTAAGSTILSIASGPNNYTAVLTPLNPGITSIYARTKTGATGLLQVTTMTPATTITTKATATQAAINLNNNNYTQNSLNGYWVSANTVYSDGSPSGVTAYTWSINDTTIATVTPSSNSALPFDAWIQPLKNGSFSIQAVPTFSTFNNTQKLYGAITQPNIISATFVPVTTYLDNISGASGTFIASTSYTNIINTTTSLTVNTNWIDVASGIKTNDPVTANYTISGMTWTGTPAGYNTTTFSSTPGNLTATANITGYPSASYSILSIATPVTTSAVDKTPNGTLYSNLKVGDTLEISGNNLTPPSGYIGIIYIWSGNKKYRMNNVSSVNPAGTVATMLNIPARVIDETANTSVITNKLLPPYTFSIKINGTNIESVPTSAYAPTISNAGIEIKSITNTNLNASVTANAISTIPNRFVNFSVIPVGTSATPNEKITLANRIITTNGTAVNQNTVSGITPTGTTIPLIPAQGTLNYSTSNPTVSFLTPTYSTVIPTGNNKYGTNTSVGSQTYAVNYSDYEIPNAPKPFPADIFTNTTSNNVFTTSAGTTYQAQNTEQIAYRATSSQNNQKYDAYANGGGGLNFGSGNTIPQGWSASAITNNSLIFSACTSQYGGGCGAPYSYAYGAPWTLIIHRFNGSPLTQTPIITGSNPLFSANASIWDPIYYYWTNPVYYGSGTTITSIYSSVNGSTYTIGLGNTSHKPTSFIDSAGTAIAITTTGIPTTNELSNGLLVPKNTAIDQISLSTGSAQNALYSFNLPGENIESAYISGSYIYFLTYSTTAGANTMSLYIADKLNPMSFAKIIPNLPVNRPNDNTVVPAEYYPTLYVTNDIASQYGYNTTNTRIYIIDIDGNLYQVML